MRASLPTLVLRSIYQGLAAGKNAIKGGDFKQVGGEFLFEGGKVVWAHRMRNTRDHAEVDVLRGVLVGHDESNEGGGGGADDGGGADGEKRSRRSPETKHRRTLTGSLVRRLSRQGRRSRSWSRSRSQSQGKSVSAAGGGNGAGGLDAVQEKPALTAA